MITENEKAKLDLLQESLLTTAVQIHGEDMSEELKSELVGVTMATIDALFAIREGEPWREMTDAKEIAREALRQGGYGD